MPVFKSNKKQNKALMSAFSENLVKNSNFAKVSLDTTKKIIPRFTKSVDYFIVFSMSIFLYKMYLNY
jgi:hypothetical protein